VQEKEVQFQNFVNERENMKSHMAQKEEKIRTLEQILLQNTEKYQELHEDYEKSQNELSHYSTHLNIDEIMAELALKEKLNYSLTDINRNLSEQTEIFQKQIATQMNQVEDIKKELETKNQQFVVIALQLKKYRQSGATFRHDPQSEVEALRAELQAHQNQNALLSSEIHQLQLEKERIIAAKNKTISGMLHDLYSIRDKYQDLRSKIIHLEGRVTTDFLNEVEDMKREMFCSLAVCLKMNRAFQGKRSNLRVDILYDKGKYVNYRDWQIWIGEQFDKS